MNKEIAVLGLSASKDLVKEMCDKYAQEFDKTYKK